MPLGSLSRLAHAPAKSPPTDFNYVSVVDAATRLQKSRRRVYQMVEEGLLREVGWDVLRIGSRIWIGIR